MMTFEELGIVRIENDELYKEHLQMSFYCI